MFNLPGSNDKELWISFRENHNEKLVPVEEDTEIVIIQGFVSKPEFAKKSRGEQFFLCER
jgi:DNA mismatch repair protein MutL